MRVTNVHATIAASAAFHALAVGGIFFWLAYRSLTVPAHPPDETSAPAPTSAPASVTVELPTVGDEVALEDLLVDRNGEPPRASGGATIARLDTGRAGHGGDAHVPLPALNLADGDERMRLSPDTLSRLDHDQLQRLRVARLRQSWEDRRSTTHPTELTLLVTGAATVLERRPAAAREPSRGALESPSPSVRGGTLGAASPAGAGETPSATGGARAGSTLGAPGMGLA
ncbi:MAG TPA: hypothetical protein VHS09_05745, partial [Polyangiaceae bacterium]|nr:hypothetical protein [Polyangiaceae bacterium]